MSKFCILFILSLVLSFVAQFILGGWVLSAPSMNLNISLMDLLLTILFVSNVILLVYIIKKQ